MATPVASPQTTRLRVGGGRDPHAGARLRGSREIRQPQRRLTPDERALVARKYEAGATADDLAAEFGCHPTTVRSAVKANGVTMRLTKTTTGQADEAVRLYRSGLSMVKVGDQLGLSARTIFNIVHECGIKTRVAHLDHLHLLLDG